MVLVVLDIVLVLIVYELGVDVELEILPLLTHVAGHVWKNGHVPPWLSVASGPARVEPSGSVRVVPGPKLVVTVGPVQVVIPTHPTYSVSCPRSCSPFSNHRETT